MVGDLLRVHLDDVTGDLMTVNEVLAVGLLRESVPLRGEDTATATRFEAEPDAADPGEEVDEGEVLLRRSSRLTNQESLKRGAKIGRQRGVARAPAVYGLWIPSQELRHLSLFKASTHLLQEMNNFGHTHN